MAEEDEGKEPQEAGRGLSDVDRSKVTKARVIVIPAAGTIDNSWGKEGDEQMYYDTDTTAYWLGKKADGKWQVVVMTTI